MAQLYFKSSTMKQQAVFHYEMALLTYQTTCCHNAKATIYAHKSHKLMNFRKRNRLFILWSISFSM